MQDDFYRLAHLIVNKCFKQFNASQRKNMSDLLTAFISNTSFTMWDIATSLSGNTSTKHKHKRLIYFLDSLNIDTMFWKCYSLVVFSLPGFRFKKRKMITLALDATTLKDDFSCPTVNEAPQRALRRSTTSRKLCGLRLISSLWLQRRHCLLR